MLTKKIEKQDKPVNKINTTAKDVKGRKQTKKTTKKEKSSGIVVARAFMSKDVVNHEPKGVAEKFAKDSKRLYCFSHIKGVKDSLTIQHMWYYKNKEIGFSNLAVKSSDWRTYSYRDIEEDQKGDWNVKIVNSENEEVLKTLKFSVE